MVSNVIPYSQQFERGILMYFVKADHPILKRIDKWVKPEDFAEFLATLNRLGYENISADYVEREVS